MDSRGADAPVAKPSRPDPVAPGAMHGGRVAVTAVAELGDAALTADDLGELRLWPALDGSRPAIPLPTEAPPTRIAIASGEDLVLAIADNAADVTLMRVGRDGTVHARAQITSDVGIDQIVFIGRDLLVRRVDQTIERYNARGTLLGRVVAAAGERLGAIATRDRYAIVASVDGDRPCKRVRWLALDGGLAWGADIPLPQAIAIEPLAISPNGRRIAAERHSAGAPTVVEGPSPKPVRRGGKRKRVPEPPVATSQVAPEVDTLTVFELGIGARAVEVTPQVQLVGHTHLGFTDNTNLAIAQTQLTWWSATPSARDPWDGEPAAVPGDASNSAVGHGVVVTAFASGLALRDPQHTRYLGWSHLVTGNMQAVGSTIAVGPTDNFYEWFDENLGEAGGIELATLAGSEGNTPYSVIAIGDHQVAALRRAKDGTRLVLVDTRDPRSQTELDVELSNPQLWYEPSLQELAVFDNHKLHRYHVSLAPLTASALPAFDLPGNVLNVRALDPARAGGAVAVVMGYDDQGYTLQSLYVDHPKPEKPRHVLSNVLAIDNAGTYYTITAPNTIVGMRDDRVVAKLPYDMALQLVVPSADGSTIALVSSTGIELRDASGKMRWQQHVWEPIAAAPSLDGRRIFVSTRGGLVALDGNDGTVVGRVCGTRFGLHDTPLTTSAFEAPPVCED